MREMQSKQNFIKINAEYRSILNISTCKFVYYLFIIANCLLSFLSFFIFSSLGFGENQLHRMKLRHFYYFIVFFYNFHNTKPELTTNFCKLINIILSEKLVSKRYNSLEERYTENKKYMSNFN